MFKSAVRLSSLFVASLLFVASTAQAATMITFEGVDTGDLVSGTLSLSLVGDTLTGTITNTSQFSADLTGFAFDIGPGNVDGFTGSIDDTNGTGVDFTFSDGDLGNVPHGFNSVILDFGYLTGGNIAGGDPNKGLNPGEWATFTVVGDFGDLTDAEIAAGLYARFQSVGADGEDSDIARPNDTPPNGTPVPEPASMMLLGTGLVYLARRRMRKGTVA